MVTQRVLLAAARCHIREHLINVMIIIADAGALSAASHKD
jgi:hypothetical protein